MFLLLTLLKIFFYIIDLAYEAYTQCGVLYRWLTSYRAHVMWAQNRGKDNPSSNWKGYTNPPRGRGGVGKILSYFYN